MLVYEKDNVKIKLITSSHYLTKLDINKFNKQYPKLNIKYSNIFHDRFIIIDDMLYHLEASLKDLGKKYTTANQTFKDFPEEDQHFLHTFSFICMLSFDVYIKKRIIEHEIDKLNETNKNKEEDTLTYQYLKGNDWHW